jgi:Fic family protein
MILLPIETIQMNGEKIQAIDRRVKAIYRLITFSRAHFADDLLNSFIASNNSLAQLLSIKNAQMEAHSDEEAQQYINDLDKAISFVIDEIRSNRNFLETIQLFQLFRLISPEAHARHPNKFRHTLVQIGSTICPEPTQIPSLISELFSAINRISHPVIRAIYFHHELIRIHPFSDGNGRTTRIAKNWMLMYDLYPPIFIKDEIEKQEYISTLSESFGQLAQQPCVWHSATASFFDQELERISKNSELIFQKIKQMGWEDN